VDGVTENDVDWGPWANLSSKIVHTLAADLTSLTIMTQTSKWGYQNTMHEAANKIGRNIPVLMIDSRKWDHEQLRPQTFSDAVDHLMELEEKLQNAGTTNFYDVSTFSYLHSAVKWQVKNSFTGGDSQKGMWVHKALSILQLRDAMETRVADDDDNYLHSQKESTGFVRNANQGQNLGVKVHPEPSQPAASEPPDCDARMQVHSGHKTLDKEYTDMLQTALLPVSMYGTKSEASELELFQQVDKVMNALNKINVQASEKLQSVHECAKLEDVRKELQECRENKNPMKAIQSIVLRESKRWMPHTWQEMDLYRELPKLHPNLFRIELIASREDVHEFSHAGGKSQRIGHAVSVTQMEGFDGEDKMRQVMEETLQVLETGFDRYKKFDWRTPMLHHQGDWETQTMNNILQMLESPIFFSANVGDIDGLNKVMARAARINRLPDANSLQTLELIKLAWEKVDIFNSTADAYKAFSNVTYMCFLLISLFTAVVTCISLNKPDILSREVLRILVTAASLSSLALTAFITFFDPATRWQQLRGASLAMESEIFKFRTRSGIYAASDSSLNSYQGVDSRQAEMALESCVEEISKHVLKSGNMAETSLLAKFNGHSDPQLSRKQALKYRHGQYEHSRIDGTFGQSNWSYLKHSRGSRRRGQPEIVKNMEQPSDDHHSPLTANEYIELRAWPQLAYYKSKLPLYERNKMCHELIMSTTMVVGVVLAFANYAEWGALPAAVATMMTAWRFVCVT